MHDDTMKRTREHFFEGMGPSLSVTQPMRTVKTQTPAATTPAEMLNRLDPRLRRLVSRACRNSYAASKVVKLFEDYIASCFTTDKMPNEDDWWCDLLLERPTVSKRHDGKCTAQLFFHPTSQTDGFHRLLLHAVGQFHGLKVVLRTVDIAIGNQKEARALIVTGEEQSAPFPYRLLKHLEAMEHSTEPATVSSLGLGTSALRVS